MGASHCMNHDRIRPPKTDVGRTWPLDHLTNTCIGLAVQNGEFTNLRLSGVSRHWSGHGQRTYIPPTNIDPENHKISQVFILGDGICKSTPKPIWYHVMILQYIMNTQFVVAADLRNTLVTWRLTFRWAFPAAHLWPQPFCWAPAMSFDRAGHAARDGVVPV